MMIIWHQCMNKHKELYKYNSYIGIYIKSIIRMLSHRCRNILDEQQNVNDYLLEFFMENFKINTKLALEDFFSQKNIELMKQKGHISIYGAGEIAKNIIPLLQEEEIDVKKIYVTFPQKNKKKLLNIPVESYKKISFEDECQFMIVAAANQNKDEIVKMLNQIKYKGRIFLI